METNDVGMLPWVPLTAFEQPAEVMVREVKDRIDRLAPANQHDEFLSVATVFTSLRFNDPQILDIFGGEKLVETSPYLEGLFRKVYGKKLEKEGAEIRQQYILRALKARFKKIPAPITKVIKTKTESARLDALLDLAVSCASLSEFESGLSA